MIRAISFDLWLTLIRSNREFKIKRSELFNQLANSDVSKIIREIDIFCNKRSEDTGLHIESTKIIKTILENLRIEEDPEKLDKKIQELFLEDLPYLYDSETKETLQELKENGIALYLVSNTGFIKGKTLESAMEKLGISSLFTHKIFSDEIGISKPNPKIFEELLRVCGYDSSEILHVGDNPIADGGSEKLGIKFFQINSNNQNIKNLTNGYIREILFV